MTIAVYIVIASGTLLGLLLGLFAYEEKRGERIGTSARRLLDTAVTTLRGFLDATLSNIGAGRLWFFLHKVFYIFFGTILFVVKKADRALTKLQLRNRDILSHAPRRDNSLFKVKQHKQDMQLSPEQQTTLKREKLEE